MKEFVPQILPIKLLRVSQRSVVQWAGFRGEHNFKGQPKMVQKEGLEYGIVIYSVTTNPPLSNVHFQRNYRSETTEPLYEPINNRLTYRVTYNSYN